MFNVRDSSVVVWVIVCAIAPSSAWADEGQCPDPEVRAGVGGRVRGGARATGGLVGDVGGGLGGLAGGAVDATGDVAGGAVDATVGVAGGVAGSLPAPGSPDVGRLGEIGLGFETEGRLDEAWLALHRFKLEAQAQYEADRARIDAAIGRIQPRLAGVIVEADVGGAEVWIRGNLAARLPMEQAIYVNPGRAHLTVRASGRAGVEIDVDAALGETARVRAELPPVGASVSGPDLDADVDAGVPDAEVSGAGPGLLFWVVGGVAVLGAGIGIGATVVRSNLSADLDAEPPGSPELEGIQGSIDTAAVWQIGAFVVGGLAVAGALVIYLVGSASADADAELECPTLAGTRTRGLSLTDATPVRRPTSSFSLACGPGGAGIGCSGTF